MKNIYESIKGILEADLKTDFSKQFKAYQSKPQTSSAPVPPPAVTIDRTQGKWATYDPETKKNVRVAAPEAEKATKLEPLPPEKPQVQKTEVKPAATKAAAKPVDTSFEKEFAKQYKEKGEGGTFDWKDPKTGKTTKIALKMKGSETKPETSDDSASKLADYNKLQKQSVEAQKKQERHSQEVERLKGLAGEDMPKAKEPADQGPDEIEKTIAAKQKEKSDKMWADARAEQEADDEATRKEFNLPKTWKKSTAFTKEEKQQMSINKKFDVSDSLYNSVMEVLQKSSGGTVPTTKKEKKLAAMHGNPNVITHGDVLKARGVKLIDQAKKRAAGEAALEQKTVSADESQLDEISVKLAKRYLDKTVDPVYGIPKTTKKIQKRLEGIRGAHSRIVGAKPTSEEVDYIDEGDKGTARRVVGRAMNKANDIISKAQKQNPDVSMRTTSLAKQKSLTKKDLSKMSSDQIKNVIKGMRSEETEYLDEAKRLISKHGAEGQKYTAKVYKDPEYNEYQVHYFKDGKHMGEGPVSYHGDDKEDAQNTADHEVKRMNSVKEGFEIIASDQIDELSRNTLVKYVNKAANLKGKEAGTRQAGLKTAAQKIADMKKKQANEEFEQVDELSRNTLVKYVNKAAAAKGKEAGTRQAGLSMAAKKIMAMKRAKSVQEGTMRDGKWTDQPPRPGTNEVPLPDEGYRPPKKEKKPTKAGSTTKMADDSEE